MTQIVSMWTVFWIAFSLGWQKAFDPSGHMKRSRTAWIEMINNTRIRDVYIECKLPEWRRSFQSSGATDEELVNLVRTVRPSVTIT